jgi:hypothetical protein
VDSPYSAHIEQAMRLTYDSLNERQRRLYAANEALKLGHGGVTYVTQLFGCHRKTVQRGLIDLRTAEPPFPANQARKKGVADVPACPSSPDSMTPS